MPGKASSYNIHVSQVSHTSGSLDIGLAALWTCQNIVKQLLNKIKQFVFPCGLYIFKMHNFSAFISRWGSPLKNFLCWLILFSINLLAKNNLGFCLFKWCGGRCFLALLGLAALPVFTESLQCDLDSGEQEPWSCGDLYLVTSFICLGLSGKGRISWMPDFLKLESKSER